MRFKRLLVGEEACTHRLPQDESRQDKTSFLQQLMLHLDIPENRSFP
jgi:hypothetical protein